MYNKGTTKECARQIGNCHGHGSILVFTFWWEFAWMGYYIRSGSDKDSNKGPVH